MKYSIFKLEFSSGVHFGKGMLKKAHCMRIGEVQ